MDTGNGKFTQQIKDLADGYPQHPQDESKRTDGVFRVGERIELRGSRFRIKKITPKNLVLRLLPRTKEEK